ncbi:putative Prolamin-like domain-containing protein [Senna tora]|uniref:Putative Prolamin-like domain-containing protein n=1 Tax=Senna tora TaxID=362788 RepID=A0A834W1B7_9FABA|nr:putative Prolamin-like domain-containing protein [Senna tora]
MGQPSEQTPIGFGLDIKGRAQEGHESGKQHKAHSDPKAHNPPSESTLKPRDLAVKVKSVVQMNNSIKMGHSCETNMVKHFLQTKRELKGQNWTQVLAKNDEICHKCGHVTKPAESQLLGLRREKIGFYCENEVFEKLVAQKNNTTIITKYCCEKLVGIGKYCSDNLVKDLLRTSHEIRTVNATDVLKRN